MILEKTLKTRIFWISHLPSVAEENRIHLERYKKFILSRPERELLKEEDFCFHHILPESMCKNTDNSNLIKLSYREHYIAHLILWKCGYKEMVRAFWMMNKFDKQQINNFCAFISGRVFTRINKDNFELQSIMMTGEGNPMYGKKQKTSSKYKNSESNKKYIWVNKEGNNKRVLKEQEKEFLCDGWVRGMIKVYTEAFKKINIGRKLTVETKLKMSNSRKGKNMGRNNPNARAIYQYDKNFNFVKKHDCITFMDKEGFCSRIVYKYCNKLKLYKNYYWFDFQYKEQEQAQT